MTARAALHARLERIARHLRDGCAELRFGPPVAFTYHPLDYAWEAHRAFLRMARPRPAILFVGMNPGPFGMAQTGVPFGEVAAVRDFLGIDARFSVIVPSTGWTIVTSSGVSDLRVAVSTSPVASCRRTR
ncbi:MAG: hypothetical protein ACKOEP_04540, partial [Phycisphaerales bacterium]